MEQVVLAIYFIGDLEGESSFERCFFFSTWTAANRKILTLDNLKRRNINIFNKCCMCKSDGESVCHLLLHCSQAYNLWTFIFSLFGVSWVIPNWFIELLACWHGGVWCHTAASIWGAIPHCIVRTIWREQNNWIFEGEERSIIELGIFILSLFK